LTDGKGVKALFIWVAKSVDAKGRVASMSQSGVPVGTYDVVIYGEALDETSKVASHGNGLGYNNNE